MRHFDHDRKELSSLSSVAVLLCLIRMKSILICVAFRVRPAGRPSCMTFNFNVGHYEYTFSPNYFILGMLLGTIGLYHFMSLLVIGRETQDQRKAKPLGFIFSFQLIRLKLDLVLKHIKLNILIVMWRLMY